MASKHEVEAVFKLKDEMSVQLENIRKRAAALEKEAKSLNVGVKDLDSTFGQVSKGLDAFAPGLGRTISSVSSLTAGLSPLALGVGAVAGGMTVAAGITAKWVGDVVELSSTLSDLSARTSLSTDALQELGHAGSLVGIEVNQIADASTNLERRLGAGLPEAEKAMKALGLSMRELLALDPDDRFRKVAEAIRSTIPESQQAAVAFQAFGKSGTALLPLIRSDIEGAIEEFRALGGVIDSDVVAAGDRLDDQLTLLSAAFTGFKGQVAGEVIPVLTDLTQTFIDLTKFVQESKDATQDNPWVDFFTDIHDTLNPLTRELNQTRSALGAFVGLRELNAIAAQGSGAGLDTLPKPPGAPPPPPRPGGISPLSDDERKRVEKEQEATLRRQTEEHRKIAKEAAVADKIYKDQLRTLLELDRAVQSMVSGIGLIDAEALGMAESWASTDAEVSAVAAGMEETFVQQAKIGTELGFHIETWEELQDIVERYPEGVGDIVGVTEDLENAQEDYNQALAAANDIAQLLGGTIGKIVGQTIGAAAALKNLKNLGGTFSSASSEAGGGFFGAIAGAGAVASAIGPLIGPIISAVEALFKLGGPDIARDAGRDMGAALSEGLEEQIEKSGKNVQLFLKEIFAEGGISVDRFAEEVGDLFSMFERGELSRETVISELMEDLPILIEHFDELGPVGEENLERIIRAAEEMGFNLGVAGDQLERLQKGIPELTLEGFQQKFDISAEQTEALKGLGIPIQTDLERLAEDLNTPVELLQQLGPEFEKFGISLEELPDFLAATGLSFDELVEKMNLPPEVEEAWRQFQETQVPEVPGEGEAAAGDPLSDPLAFGDAAGAGMADRLQPSFRQLDLNIGMKLDQLNTSLPAAIARAVEGALARSSP